MEDLAIGVAANICFKLIEAGGGFVKKKFIEIFRNEADINFSNDNALEKIADTIDAMSLDEDMSEKKIKKLMLDNSELMKLFSEVKPQITNKNVDINQYNIHGNNIVNGINL